MKMSGKCTSVACIAVCCFTTRGLMRVLLESRVVLLYILVKRYTVETMKRRSEKMSHLLQQDAFYNVCDFRIQNTIEHRREIKNKTVIIRKKKHPEPDKMIVKGP